jgi:hypothetical protein
MSLSMLIAAVVVLLAVLATTVFLLILKPRAGVIVLVVLLSVAVAAVVNWKPIYKTRTPRFAEEVKKVADPLELQQWAMTILQDTQQSASSAAISKEKVPVGIRNLVSDGSPLQYAFCQAGSVRDRTVWIVWGGGFRHRGIRVGAPSFKVSPDDDNYYIEWKPGIYFWHQTR